jgi:small subunit ribosomal protein S20
MQKNLSAIKRMKQNEKRRIRNKAAKSKVFTYFKKMNSAIEEDKGEEEIMNAYKQWQKILDKTTGKGIIKKNTASRRKSKAIKRIRTALNSQSNA